MHNLPALGSDTNREIVLSDNNTYCSFVTERPNSLKAAALKAAGSQSPEGWAGVQVGAA